MGISIQDYAKKINSRLTIFDCISLLITTIFLLSFFYYLAIKQKSTDIPVSYIINREEKSIIDESESKPFGSRTGKTYTFSWCSGSKRISAKNKIYFINEVEARNTGRTLSKLCSK